ncbi:type II secretion system protein [Phycisphaerales bacterium AB-hyl4]|uniref:Type II secretion system protein n=1 Tax=Natronomicrosphaera hydrolytica TaxID=3242702 RepID=A0ABV4U8M0_9BACT
MRTNKGFTLIELLVVISIIALLIGILLPALGAARATARRMQSNTQIRGIHQAMVMFAQSNRSNFPGLSGQTGILDTGNGVTTGDFRANEDGDHPATRFAILLNGNFFTPEYIISPSDTGKDEADGDDTDNNVGIDNYSYAMLDIRDGESPQRSREWSETLNTEAVAVSDRAKGGPGNDIYSVHTRDGSGDWRGGVARNDNSVSFETTHVLRTRFGSGPLNADNDGGTDNIFEEDDDVDGGTAVAHMVYIDEETAYDPDN